MDRDTKFTGQFWRELRSCIQAKLNVNYHMSTTYHPQSDGQTERTNRILEGMLRHYVSPLQNNWDKLLPYAEFAINNSYQESIKTTYVTFMVNTGRHPKLVPENPKAVEGASSGRVHCFNATCSLDS